jgi:hypothetical protein
MAVGNPTDVGGLNSRLGDSAVGLRDASRAIVALWNYIASLGADQAAQTAALVTLGFSSGDAATFWTKANNLFAVAQVYYGLGTQPSAFNFDSALAGVRGPT